VSIRNPCDDLQQVDHVAIRDTLTGALRDTGVAGVEQRGAVRALAAHEGLDAIVPVHVMAGLVQERDVVVPVVVLAQTGVAQADHACSADAATP
jgi:hypothetical protein